MRTRLVLICTAIWLIHGCSPSDNFQDSYSKSEESLRTAASAPVAEEAESMASDETADQTVQSYLAYRYNYGFELPAKVLPDVANSHAQQCLDAGPGLCQVLNSSTSAQSSDYVSAYLSLRAEPAWLEKFTESMTSSVEDANGDMTSSSVSAEDLTRAILDTDARLKAKRTLRTRLENLLETRNAELSDLLALERELSRVQGEIESTTSQLKALRARVNMSRVDISYSNRSVAVSQSALSPIARALKDFVRVFAEGLGLVINFIAALLPWLVFVILPLLWLLRWFFRRRKKSRREPEQTP